MLRGKLRKDRTPLLVHRQRCGGRSRSMSAALGCPLDVALALTIVRREVVVLFAGAGYVASGGSARLEEHRPRRFHVGAVLKGQPLRLVRLQKLGLDDS